MILLDTNIISELMKTDAALSVDHWYLMNEAVTALSATAIGELAYGISRLPMGARRNGLEARLTEWRLRYANRTFPFTTSTAMLYGSLLAHAVMQGHNMSVPDAQIAALAVEHGFSLATRNVKDFATTNVVLINPFTPQTAPS